jgi:hypothetical protein
VTRKFEGKDDDKPFQDKDDTVPMTVKVFAMRALDQGVSMRVAPQQGGCTMEERQLRGALHRRLKKANGEISLGISEIEMLKRASHDAIMPPFLHDQFCEMLEDKEPEKKE